MQPQISWVSPSVPTLNWLPLQFQRYQKKRILSTVPLGVCNAREAGELSVLQNPSNGSLKPTMKTKKTLRGFQEASFHCQRFSVLHVPAHCLFLLSQPDFIPARRACSLFWSDALPLLLVQLSPPCNASRALAKQHILIDWHGRLPPEGGGRRGKNTQQ